MAGPDVSGRPPAGVPLPNRRQLLIGGSVLAGLGLVELLPGTGPVRAAARHPGIPQARPELPGHRPTTTVKHHPAYHVRDLLRHASKHAIALTIDDGPDPEWTPAVLRLLDHHRVRATFCVVGVHVAAYPRLVRDAHRAGHAIANHSYTHVQPFATQSDRRIEAEIARTQRAVERAAKVTPQLFRSPGGDWSRAVYRTCAAYDLEPLDWDVDPQDWRQPGTATIEQTLLQARPDDIVLCHDGGGDRRETVHALRHVVPEWQRRGYHLVPLVLHHDAPRH